MFWPTMSEIGWESDPWFGSTWQSLRKLQDEVNGLFENASSQQGYAYAGFPAVNMWAGSEEAQILAELPGVNAQNVNLSVSGNELVISGERSREEVGEGERLLRHERVYGPFSRTVTLPFPVNGEKAEASYRNGLLRVVLPRAEADKPRKIAIR